MAKVMIFGGEGFIGSHLARIATDDGHIILNHSINSDGNDLAGSSLMDLRLSEANLRNIQTFLDVLRPDVVIHLAGSLLPASDHEAYSSELKNILAPTVSLCEMLGERQIPLIFVSSGGAVYGNSASASCSEADRCDPISFYGYFKLEVERCIEFAHRRSGLPYLIIRPSNPYGRTKPLIGPQGFVSAAVGAAMYGKPLEIWGDGSAVRDYLFIDDLCWSVSKLLAEPPQSEILNIGSGIGISLKDIIRTVEHATGRSIDVRYKSSRSTDVSKVVLDVSRLIRKGHLKSTPIEIGISKFIDRLEPINGKKTIPFDLVSDIWTRR